MGLVKLMILIVFTLFSCLFVLRETGSEKLDNSLIVYFFLFSVNYNQVWMSETLCVGMNLTKLTCMFMVLIFFCFFILSSQFHNFMSNYFHLRSLYLCVFLVLNLFFLMDNIVLFYIFFEVSVIPLFIIIISWGVQVERFNAGFWMFFYTVVAALPMLIVVVIYKEKFFVCTFSMLKFLSVNFLSFDLNFFDMFGLGVLLGFLVKFPMFGGHLWLPQAHVEAPLMGSIILAGVMLKLAGYGVIMFSPLLMNLHLITFLKFFSAWGGVFVSFICVYEKDMKKLIAYTSVAHMSFVIFGCLDKSSWGQMSGMLFMLAHGVCSSGLFLGAYYMYTFSKSRSLVLTYGFLSQIPLFTVFIFMMCLGNMSAPPSANFFAEIYSMVCMISKSLVFMFPLFFTTFLSVGYSMLFYSSSQYGQVCDSLFVSFYANKNSDFLSWLLFIFWLFFISFVML